MSFVVQRQWVFSWIGVVLFLCSYGVASAEPTIDQAITAAKSSDEAARIKALDWLAAQRGAAAPAVGMLTELLGDKSVKVRAHAVHALGRIGSPAKLAALPIANLAKDQDAVVRQQAVKAIIRIQPGPEVMLPVFLKLMEDPDAGVRMRILDAITDAGPMAVPGLINALDNEKAAYFACIILRQIGPGAKDAVPALVKSLKSKQLEIPREAALALGAIGPAAAPALPQLVAALDDKNLREAATLAIGQIGSAPADVDAKLMANAQSDDKFLSSLSYWALARIHPENKQLRTTATQQLVDRLSDKEPFIRAAVARGLASLPPAPEITLPILEKALQNADEATTKNILEALASIGPAAVPKLVDALKHKNLRGDILVILGDIGPAAAPATEALAKLVSDEETEVAVEAALALGKIGPAAKGAVPALVAALQREGATNSHAVIYAIGNIGPAAAAAEPTLLKLMESKDLPLAAIAAWATTRLHPGSAEVVAKAVPVIVASLAEPLPESRAAAAEALGNIGPLAKSSMPALENATRDSSPLVQAAAAKALEAIKGVPGR